MLYTSSSGTKSERRKKRAAAENRTGPGFSYDVEYAMGHSPLGAIARVTHAQISHA